MQKKKKKINHAISKLQLFALNYTYCYIFTPYAFGKPKIQYKITLNSIN